MLRYAKNSIYSGEDRLDCPKVTLALYVLVLRRW